MKLGDLVKRKPRWGAWTKHNPWMISEKDLEVGVVVSITPGSWPKDWDMSNKDEIVEMRLNRRVDVLWSSGTLGKAFAESSLEIVSQERVYEKDEQATEAS
tara:strand:- start:634 stop:936 length:303 start_codon:yes stop_codon:yes gene_type:complete